MKTSKWALSLEHEKLRRRRQIHSFKTKRRKRKIIIILIKETPNKRQSERQREREQSERKRLMFGRRNARHFLAASNFHSLPARFSMCRFTRFSSFDFLPKYLYYYYLYIVRIYSFIHSMGASAIPGGHRHRPTESATRNKILNVSH